MIYKILYILLSIIITINCDFIKFDERYLNEINNYPAPKKSFNESIAINSNVIQLFEKHQFNNNVNSKIETLSTDFKKSINRLRALNNKIDVIFLIDSSSSVGKNNFMSEIKFVKKLLSDFNVSYNTTRVSLITFSSQGKIVSRVF